MSSNITYGIEIEFLTSGAFTVPYAALGRLQNGTDKWSKSLLGGVQTFATGFDNAVNSVGGIAIDAGARVGAVLGGALATGLGVALKDGFSFAQYTEDLTNGIAGTLSMLGGVEFDQGIKEAAESTENLRQLALKLPGTFKQAANAYSYILPVGLEHGVDRKRLQRDAAYSVAGAASLGISPATAGHEYAAMLEGRATSRMPLFAKLGLGSATAFNALPFEKRFDKVEAKLLKLGPMMDRFGTSFSGLASAAGDQAQNVAKTFASPLFDSVKGELSHALDWFGRNEGTVQAFAANLGLEVDYVFHRALDKIRLWTPAAMTFAHTISTGLHQAFDRVAPYLDKLETVSLQFMQDPKAFDHLLSGAKTLLALKAGSSALSFGAGGLESIGGLLSGAGVGATELAAAAPWAAVALATFAIGVEGATRALTDSTSEYHDSATRAAEEIRKNATAGAVELKSLEESTRGAREAIGTHWIQGLAIASMEVKFFADVLHSTARVVGAGLDKEASWGRQVAGFFGLGKLKNEEPIIPRTPFDYLPAVKLFTEAGINKDPEKVIPKHVVNFHPGAIQIKVEGSADPNRVAELAVDKLNRQVGLAVARNGGRASIGRSMGIL